MPAKRPPSPCRSHPLYNRWDGIKQRCHNPRHHAYKNYGGRNITLHEPWFDAKTFIRDVEQELGPFPQGRGWTLDRRDNNKGYQPGNLRYAKVAEQNRNKRTVSFVTVDGTEYALIPGMMALGLTLNEAAAARGSFQRGKSLAQAAAYYGFDADRVSNLFLARRRQPSKWFKC